MSSQDSNALGFSESFSRLEQALAAHRPSFRELDGFIPAAVVVLLWIEELEPYLLLIRRSKTLHIHPGEIALPGGRKDPWDPHLRATALRELQEEVGVKASEARLLGRLDQDFSFSGYSIAPFVCAVDSPPVFRPNKKEVMEILPMPLAHLRLEDFESEERWFLDRSIRSWRLETKYGPIWGATARILRGFSLFLKEHEIFP